MSIDALKKLKPDTDSSTSLGDFAENHQLLIQDKVQGFHWNNSQYTLHPFVIYYQENNELKKFFCCVIPDVRKSDAALFYKVQKANLADFKCKLSRLSAIIYFTDGCAGQDKNREKKHL